MKVLLLGGTAEARALAATLLAEGFDVTSSLAGRVSRPALPSGRVRIGGFGGVDGLVDHLRGAGVEAVVDATHPFAARMSDHASAACAITRTPLVRLERPGWSDHPDAATWTWVPDTAAAVRAGAAAARPVLTTGRQTLADYLPWADRPVLARVVDPPDFVLPPAWRLVTSRGPYGLDGERALLADHRADLLVIKDSGGTHTIAKLDAARELGVPVVVIARPTHPLGTPTVASADQAAAWVDSVSNSHP